MYIAVKFVKYCKMAMTFKYTFYTNFLYMLHPTKTLGTMKLSCRFAHAYPGLEMTFLVLAHILALRVRKDPIELPFANLGPL